MAKALAAMANWKINMHLEKCTWERDHDPKGLDCSLTSEPNAMGETMSHA